MKEILFYLWQLPQNILGLLLVFIYKAKPFTYRFNDSEYPVYLSEKMHGGISLGKYVILSVGSSPTTVCHEHGHQIQSLRLGWLYLLVVGLWSGLRAGLNLYEMGHYYDAFPEDWADRLGGVKRDINGRRYVYVKPTNR